MPDARSGHNSTPGAERGGREAARSDAGLARSGYPGTPEVEGGGREGPRSGPGHRRVYFGTDGVRGVAGEFVTAELALGLGRAATARLQSDRPQVLVIRDTRESGEMLEAAIAAGVTAA